MAVRVSLTLVFKDPQLSWPGGKVPQWLDKTPEPLELEPGQETLNSTSLSQVSQEASSWSPLLCHTPIPSPWLATGHRATCLRPTETASSPSHRHPRGPAQGTVPLGWMKISTGLSKVCLLAKVIMMLLAERADGAASARISWVGLSTPKRHRKAG